MIVRIIVTCVFSILLGALALVHAQRGGGISSGESAPANWYGKGVALVVGIDSYSGGWSRLSQAESDAKRMGRALKDRGFKVKALESHRNQDYLGAAQSLLQSRT